MTNITDNSATDLSWGEETGKRTKEENRRQEDREDGGEDIEVWGL